MTKELEGYLVPVAEAELAPLLQRFQERLCAAISIPISLLYIADPMGGDFFRFEAGAGLVTQPQPLQFRIGEGFLGQVVLERQPLTQTFPGSVIGQPLLSALVEVESVVFHAVPLLYQQQVEGVWVAVASSEASLQAKLSQEEWQDLLYKWAAYLHSIRSRRYIQSLLEQSQVQNQELITREEELRQNLEELAVTQEEMRRTQQFIAERARWQDFVIDLFTLMAGVSALRFPSVARIFLAQLGQYVDAQACVVLSPAVEGWHTLFSWKARKATFTPPPMWHFSPETLAGLVETRSCTTRTAMELNLSEAPSDWVLVPYFTPQGVGGLLMIGFESLRLLEGEATRAYLHAAIAFFSAYERVQATLGHEQDLLAHACTLSGAQIETLPLAEATEGRVPWIDRIPLVQREAYIRSIQEAIQERKAFWSPPSEIASRELLAVFGSTLFRAIWP